MRIIFSRKGFDSAAGGTSSPIVEGRPVSLPIPTSRRSNTTYGDLNLGPLVEARTRGRISADNLCHCDPMFENGRCAFGQTGTAQSHLANNHVAVGDTFLFFGLFTNEDGKDRHHRFFGWLRIEEIVALGANPSKDQQPAGFSHQHPHTIGEWNPNNTLYLGPGAATAHAHPSLRLTVPGAQVSNWTVPEWLQDTGLTYHANADRWGPDGTLNIVARGQEFVADVSDRADAGSWLKQIIATLEA